MTEHTLPAFNACVCSLIKITKDAIVCDAFNRFAHHQRMRIALPRSLFASDELVRLIEDRVFGWYLSYTGDRAESDVIFFKKDRTMIH